MLSFSGVTHRYFSDLGFDTRQVQYFPELPPQQEPSPNAAAPAIFFWVRMRDPDWSTLKTLLGGQRPRRVVMRFAPDPRETPSPPDEADVRGYNIELHQGWMAREAYLDLLRGCDLFMAPRRLEGIGMAALEAMAMGIPVIAADRATMNEYIRHGITGYLYDPDRPAPLEFHPGADMRRALLQDMQAGRARWLREEVRVSEFVAADCRTGQSPGWRLRRAIRR